MQDLGYIQVMGLNKLLQEYNLLQDLHGGNGILSGGPKHAVEQFGHDVLLQALVHKKTHQGVWMKVKTMIQGRASPTSAWSISWLVALAQT